MRDLAHLYYDETLRDLVLGQTLTVTGAEAHHAVNVARLRAGEQVLLSDGAGLLAEVAISATVPGKQPSFTAVVQGVDHRPQAYPQLVLVQALAKGGSDERAVQLCTELGVDVFAPWQAARSVAVWQGAAKQAKGVEKWARIAREAAKQSLRPYCPTVTDVVTSVELERWAAAPETLMLVLHPWQQQRVTEILRQRLGELAKLQRIVVVVGPEGGLSDQEVARLQGAGASVGVLGQQVLRTSSAGAAAAAVLQTLLQRW